MKKTTTFYRCLSSKIRSQSRKNNCFPHIPEEIIFNILSKLPTKSLGRFRCVSKQWYGLISETKTHQQKLVFISDIRPHPPHNEYRGESEVFYFFSTFDDKKCLKQIGKSRQPRTLHSGNFLSGNLRLMGSCNGLVLVREDSNLILWNPTRDCKYVLNYPALANNRPVFSGLCFDPHTKSYKILLSIVRGGITMVGNCKSKSWKEIQLPCEPISVRTVRTGPVFNDRLHWYISLPPHCIIYFDARKDEFVNLPMPEPVRPSGDILTCLVVLDECLCMTRIEVTYELGGIAQILAMKEYGVKESWTVLFKIKGNNVGVGSFVPYFYSRKRNQVLMKDYYGSNVIVAYDLNTDRTVEVATPCFIGDAIVFEETLVKPPDYDYGDENDQRDGDSFIVNNKISSRARKLKKAN